MFNKQELLDAVAGMPRVKSIQVPGVGEMCVRQISEADADDLYEEESNAIRRNKFIVLAVCDQDGKRLFTDDDLDTIAEWPLSVKVAIWTKGGRFNGLIPSDEDEGKAKNPETTQSGSSR